MHITVCICTFRRPQMLAALLHQLAHQSTQGLFDYSVSVADNDHTRSAQATVEAAQATLPLSITYAMEPEQNIARARNKAVSGAQGDFLAFIDDDELPGDDWLLQALRYCLHAKADGVLGPVRPRFEGTPATWLTKGRFFERPEPATGHQMTWRETRTGNVLLRRELLRKLDGPFNVAFGSGGEDQEFFKRLIEQGAVFVWCNEAPVYETVPAERCTRSYLLKRALQRGQSEKTLTDMKGIAKSLVAVPAYTLMLPWLFLAGHHHFMRYLIRLCDHLGKLLGLLGLRPTGERYVS
jgi:succinoglycan biosynthesis protein ExoM